MDHLPWGLLGIRTAWRADLAASPAELVYGEPLHVPGELVTPASSSVAPVSDFVRNLKRKISLVRPTPMTHNRTVQTHIPASLASGRVYVRVDAVKPPLHPRYSGPYDVLNRTDKFFTLHMNNKCKNVSIDRLKPAHEETPLLPSTDSSSATASSSSRVPLPSQRDVFREFCTTNERENSRNRRPRGCLLYTSPSPRDKRQSRMPSSA